MFLETLYQIIYKLGKIDKLPNMPDVIKTINELAILHNDVYQILKYTPDETQCIDKLEKLKVSNHTEPVFSKERVLEIIKDKKKIMEPFDTVFYHRINKTRPSKLQFVHRISKGGAYSKKRSLSISRHRGRSLYQKSIKRGGSTDTEADAGAVVATSAAADVNLVTASDSAVAVANADSTPAAVDNADSTPAAVANADSTPAAADAPIAAGQDNGDTSTPGKKPAALDLTTQITTLQKEIEELKQKTQDTQNKERDLKELQLIQELQKIMTENKDIEKPEIKKEILDKLTEIHQIREERKILGCLKKDFETGHGIWAYMPEFMRPNGETGGKFKEYMDMFIETKDSIIGTAKNIATGLGIDSICKLINKKVEAKDWVLYPMWSLEQTHYFGEGISVQLDFLSLIVSQLDALYKVGAMSMSGAKMGIIQSALTAMAASTGGVAIAAAPVIGPAMGVAYDIGVYLFGNMANIINMFIMISRKKHDSAFTLLTDIIPGMATTLNKAVNFLSILTSLSGKTINILDNFTALLDSSFLKEEFKDIDGPTKVLPFVGRMVKDKVDLHIFVETNMLAPTFVITDEMTYKFVENKEGQMIELDPEIKAAYIIDQELYPCVLLNTRDNMIYVGKYYNERFVSSIKRENKLGSSWIEESNNIFIGNIDEITPGENRKLTDYKTLKDCGYRLFVKDNSNDKSSFYSLYMDKDSSKVPKFIRSTEEKPDRYKTYDAALESKIVKTSPPGPIKPETTKASSVAETLDIEEGVGAEAPSTESIEVPSVVETSGVVEEGVGAGSPSIGAEAPSPGAVAKGGSRFKSRTNKKSRKSRYNINKSLKRKKLNRYSIKHIHNKRRNVSLYNH